MRVKYALSARESCAGICASFTNNARVKCAWIRVFYRRPNNLTFLCTSLMSQNVVLKYCKKLQSFGMLNPLSISDTYYLRRTIKKIHSSEAILSVGVGFKLLVQYPYFFVIMYLF